MGKDNKSYVKGHKRRRPGGGWTYVKPHTRPLRKAGVIGAVVFAVALAAFAAAVTRDPAPPPPPPSPSVTAPAPTEEPPLPTEGPSGG